MKPSKSQKNPAGVRSPRRRRTVLTRGSTTLLIATLLLAIVPAAASATSDLLDATCVSAESCLAVGLSDSSGSTQALGKKWNGTSWSEVSAPTPTGAFESQLAGISCRSSSDCVAVGSYLDETAKKRSAFAVQWNGTTWSTLTSPAEPSGSTDFELTSVSCAPSGSVCMAAGDYTDEGGAKRSLAMLWNGEGWTQQTLALPEGSTSSRIDGVACATTTACQAVGSYVDNGGTTRALGNSWNGTSWSSSSAPAPEGATLSELTGVSCASTYCVAVGRYVNASGVRKTYGVAGVGSWSLSTMPVPAEASLSELANVSCASSTSCTAVGSYELSSDTLPLALRWNGTSWTEQAVPTETLGALTAKFASVSCPSTTACHAVGSIVYGHAATNRALAYGYNGSWALTESGGFQRTWSRIDLPNPSTIAAAPRSDVACPSTSLCIRVGSLLSGETSESRAKSWDGGSWSVMTTPSPSGATSSQLSGVACPSTTSCRAVGSYVDSEGTTKTLSLSWNGTSWSVTSTPNPSGAKSSQLSRIACPSTTSCRAVGSYVDAEEKTKTLSLTWNGTSWSTTTTPNPSEASSSELSGVSCSSTTSCRAVGSYVESHITKTLVMTWNGTSWSIGTSPNPSGAKLSSFADVHCVSSTSCMAVGTSISSAGTQKAIAARLSGTTWTLAALEANLGEFTPTTLEGVWCSSSTACRAVGTLVDATSGAETMKVLAGQYSPIQIWTQEYTEKPGGSSSSSLADIGCATSLSCMTVGLTSFAEHPGEELASEYAGSWSLTDPLTVASRLYGVSCGSSSSCFAVGDHEVGETREQRVWQLSGEDGWSQMTTPSVSGSSLNDVWCTDETHCTAVGAKSEGATLAERWNGSSWATQTTVKPSGATSASLNSVACPSATNCMAVGQYAASGLSLGAFSEEWNGSSWTLRSVPVPTGSTQHVLYETSCTSASYCFAVGLYKNSSGANHALVEYWNGTSWQIQTPPEPSGATGSSLIGVSCTSSSACTAVGTSSTAGGESLTYVVRWNGTSWSIQSSPNMEGAKSTPVDVSCFTSVKCVAVGQAQTGSGQVPFAMGWDGSSWSIETAPGATNANNVLEGVACRKAADCVAVGRSSNGRTWELALKSIEAKATGGQATVLEGGGAIPELTAGQEEAAEALIAEDPAFKSAIEGAEYTLTVGPWTERTAEGAELLVGVVAEVDLKANRSWGEWWSWPSIGYNVGAYEYGTYSSETLPASASKIDEVVVSLDAETDKSGNFLGGEVVQLSPTAEPGSEGDVTLAPSVAEETNPEIKGY